ncbi:MAG TPA: polyprenyl synthetase family protein [Candidatus Pelagibacter bacterium]|nr:geranyl transferase [Pelagibacteraceae bacterium]HJN84258.1 polyprenyl synthetase family protein [Candidatus Pelagibacter bacterium]|tara:strand:+ start:227 stop:1099 length:873 start_codon:yes stop_codon:yes gene_type:complete
MLNDLNRIAKDTNFFLKKYLRNQKYSGLISSMNYGLFSGGKKIRSKILVDVGKIFNVSKKKLIIIGAAVECIHAYSLIHDDLPCMDNDLTRRGKPSTHVKFGEAIAVLTGNSLLTLAFEILSDKKLKIKEKTKNILIDKLSKCAGHTGIAGGQFLDLDFEKKNIPFKKIIDMQLKKTGKLFGYCSSVPAIIKNSNYKKINTFEAIGSDLGLLFQISDDLIDYKGDSIKAGKKTKKDNKLGKATLISLLGYKKTVIYSEKLRKKIIKKIKKYGQRSKSLSETIDYILKRNK